MGGGVAGLVEAGEARSDGVGDSVGVEGIEGIEGIGRMSKDGEKEVCEAFEGVAVHELQRMSKLETRSLG